MRIGVIPPVPMEPFVASRHEVVNLWSAFFTAEDRDAMEETAALAGFPANFSAYARYMYGYLFEKRIEAVYYPEPGLPKEVRRALTLASQQGVEIVPFSFPLFQNEARLRSALENLRRRLEVEAGVLETVLGRIQEVRTSLRRYDGLQARTAAYDSRQYVTLLARAMDPRGDVGALRREVERAILELCDRGRDRWCRVGLIGLPPYRPAFYETLESLSAVVVYDEWGLENNPMAPTPDLTGLYHACTLPYGNQRRLERILKEIASRRIQAVVFGVEYLCDALRDEGFFRARLPVPVAVFENRGGESLSLAEERALRRLVEAPSVLP